jgi:Thioesterase-like superfamily
MAWFRMWAALVAGEETSGLCRVPAAADSGNGISSELDIRRYLFVNADLNVHLRRPPVGEWVGLDSRTTIDAGGIGLADTLLLDEQSAIGRASQSLFVAERR